MPKSAAYTEPTTSYWQRIVTPAQAAREAAARSPDLAADSAAFSTAPSPGPWRFGYPARLPDGRVLVLPIRALASDPTLAVASLILNQAALDVIDTLGAMLAERLRPFAPDLILGLPTLGLSLAPVVARALGHSRYVPMGYSRKFWYEEALSTPVHSITSPQPGKRMYLDPNQRALLKGQRVVIVDDAVSTGTTMRAAWDLLEGLGVNVTGCGAAMQQGGRWAEVLGPDRADRVAGVFESPLLRAGDGGWVLRE